jgi:hypothetical protein
MKAAAMEKPQASVQQEIAGGSLSHCYRHDRSVVPMQVANQKYPPARRAMPLHFTPCRLANLAI